jgi:hypothetical protein
MFKTLPKEPKKPFLESPKQDIFDKIELDVLKPYVAPPRVEVQLTDEIRAIIRAQVAAEVAEAAKTLKPETKIIEKTIKMPEKVVVKEFVDKSAEILREAEKRIKKEIDALDKSGRFGPIVVPSAIPNQSGQGGKILSTDGSNAKWITNPGGGGGSSSDVYVPNNVTTVRTFDATLTSLDEIANVIGSLIQSLQGAGIIK